ncbi:helix-turn-helix transcriptional regulator [Escherichia coli]|nr:helix-turn-helix transcriptional regulator [Escherichia coli]
MIPERLKAARLRANLTQEQLGVRAGIAEDTACSRLSQYESGTHKPTFKMVCAFARVLHVPECYFYAQEDTFAEAILRLYDGETVQWNIKIEIVHHTERV